MSSESYTTGEVILSRELTNIPFNLISTVFPSDQYVVSMKKEYFGGSYNIRASSRFTPYAPGDETGKLEIIIAFKNGKYVKIDINTAFKEHTDGIMATFATILAPTSTSTFVQVSENRSEVSASIKYDDNGTVMNVYLTQLFTINSNPNFCKMEAIIEQQYASIVNIVETPSLQLSKFEPTITINAETDVFLGRNLGQAYFLIKDTIGYDRNNGVIIEDDFVLTQFTRSPNLTEVVYGDGCTLIEKVFDLTGGEDMNTLLSGIIAYGMLRYFLSRLIYGNFNVLYLLGEYEDQFFTDLSGSRYRSFMEAFDDPKIKGYGKYFVYNLCSNRKKTI